MKFRIINVLFLLIIIQVNSQTQGVIADGEIETKPICAFDTEHFQAMKTNDTYRKEYLKREKQRILALSKTVARSSGPIYTMPCVVHIVHGGAPLGSTENPGDAIVVDVIDEASLRYRHAHTGAGTYTNPYYGIDSEIELCMANQNPNGNYSTGVTRHYAPNASVGSTTYLAAALDSFCWDKSLYINLFIVSDLTNAAGVFVGNDFTIYDAGAYWSGLVAHELGHYFSLAHTFSGGCVNSNCLTNGDGVCDTPPKTSSGTTGPCGGTGNACTADDDDLSLNNPYRPVSNGGLGDQPDMLENYMDYTAPCWDAFTQGQVDRMRNHIASNRLSIANNSSACDPLPAPLYEVAMVNIVDDRIGDCRPNGNVQCAFLNLGSSVITSLQLDLYINNVLITTHLWQGSLDSGQTTSVIILDTVAALVVGDNLVWARLKNPNGQNDANPYNNEGFTNMNYYGGQYCLDYTDCSTFNPNSAQGSGNYTFVDIPGPFFPLPEGFIDILICVETFGDQSYIYEVFNIFGEDSNFYGQTNPGSDCGGYTPEICFSIDSLTYNNWIADDLVTITLDPDSTFINPVFCSVNEACATMHIVVDPDTLIYGCANPGAHNYDPNATIDDGSCLTCTDMILNGDEANIDCGGTTCLPCDTTCPDLTITQLTYQGSLITVTFTNIGYVTAIMDNTIVLQGYWSSDTFPTGAGAGGWVIGLVSPDLAPGESFTWSWNSSNPSYQYLVMSIDNSDGMDECYEFNNVAWVNTWTVYGCLNPLAHNYNPAATADDGSCLTCDDGILNGDEIGVDCGGAICDLCTILGHDCPHTLNLNSSTIQNGRYKANYLLQSNNVLLGINHARYESGSRISLQPNFEVPLGVEFEAIIKDCIPE